MIYREVYGPNDSCELEVQSRGEALEIMFRGALVYVKENDDAVLEELVEARDEAGVIKHLKDVYLTEVILP